MYKESNHPPFILRQTHLSIETRFSKHSSNEEIFKVYAQIYQDALIKSGMGPPINIPKIYKQQQIRNQTTLKKNNLVQ